MGTGVVGAKSHPRMVRGVTWRVERAAERGVGTREGGLVSWALKITRGWFAG